MQYLGGKSRLAPKFAPILREALAGGRLLVEPFVGGFNVVPALGGAPGAYCSDLHPGLAVLYAAVRDGWEPPAELSEERYRVLAAQRDWSNPETAFAAFGCSFGGKEFGGYARSRRGARNFARVTRESLLRKRPFMVCVEFDCRDYQTLALDDRHVAYLDPPYAGTTRYGRSLGDFDSVEFARWAEEQADRGALVYVSEFEVPDRLGWDVIWEMERKIAVTGLQDTATKVDRLYRVRRFPS